MSKAKRRGEQAGRQKKTSKRKRQREIRPQTEQPFEQMPSGVSDSLAARVSRQL